jgi:endonuclease YncB( thermonuclease family)
MRSKPPATLYRYRVLACEVMDGDTVRATLDLGFDVHYTGVFRLLGIDTPEKRLKATRAAAAVSQARLQQLVSEALTTGSLVVTTEKGDPKEKYGRYLAVLSHGETGPAFNDILVSEGLAVPYFGGAK